ncbi:MAG: head maturation protease, ClpP-related [bacterium]
MREINLNGYIDDEVWFGDEITPESLHETLYEPGMDSSEEVHIRLNSYGGSCNAAVRMHDDLVAYPGKISITISGTAASAATVLAMAADTLEMTPGSLFMIHDPIVGAIGNEADLMDAINLLRACKDSIINVYATRTLAGRDQIARMMKETTWMDAEAALAYGFIDRIAAPSAFGTVINCAVAREVAEKKVQLWVDRHKQLINEIRKKEQTVNSEEDKPDDHEAERLSLGEAGVPATAENAPAAPPAEAPAPEPADEPAETGEAEAPDDSSGARHPDGRDAGTPVSQLRKRLALIMPSEAKR